MRSLKLAVALVGLSLVAGCGGDTGLLDLTLAPDPQAPPVGGTTVELSGSGSIVRRYAGSFPPAGGNVLRLQYPDLPARVITFSVRVRDTSGCLVGESPAPFDVRIEAGRRVTATTTVRRSSTTCADAGMAALDGATGLDVVPQGPDTPGAWVDAGSDAAVDWPAVPDAPPHDLQVPDGPTMDAAGRDSLVSVDIGTAPADAPVGEGPIIISFTATPATVSVGSGTTLTAVYANAAGTSVDHGIGSVTSGNGVSTGPLTATTTYKLTAVDGIGNTTTRAVTVTVVPLPTITSFGALMPSIARGTLTQLTAVFTGATANIDNNIGVIGSGVPVPTMTLVVDTTFTLTVTNAAGASASRATTVTVSTATGPGAFTATGTMTAPRSGHRASLLADGRVLVTGGIGDATTEVYDPLTGTFSPTGSMVRARLGGHTATLLRNGKVLVVGGSGNTAVLADAEIFDPTSGTFAAAGTLGEARESHTATLLEDGKVLFAGGTGSKGYLASAELYDPRTGQFLPAGAMSNPRTYHSANLLPDDSVLMAGGLNVSNTPPRGYVATADLWDPRSRTFSSTGALFFGRCAHEAVSLGTGAVLLVGGQGQGGPTFTSEIYETQRGTFTSSASLNRGRYRHTATLLPSGAVLVVGGSYPADSAPLETEIRDVVSGRYVLGGPTLVPRQLHTATLLTDGKVLLAGGLVGDSSPASSSSELYW